MQRFLLAVGSMVAILGAPTLVSAQTFEYFGENGPEFWGGLSPAWVACGTGRQQSPVDFRAPHPQLWRSLAIEYGATEGEIFNNGHTIEIETQGSNRLILDGVAYELKQFHFHTASEHRVNGRGFDMEMHLVHASASGANAVIGVFLKRGDTSGALAAVFDALPDDVNVKHRLEEPFNPEALLPTSRQHVRYTGSLTTPPCTEGVEWILMDEPVTVSDEDMAQFAERIHFNARPVQRHVKVKPRHD